MERLIAALKDDAPPIGRFERAPELRDIGDPVIVHLADDIALPEAEALRGGLFRNSLENGHGMLGSTCGKMRRYRIRDLPGDRVRVELSPYDLTRGRIVFRHR